MNPRPEFNLRFADGGSLSLGTRTAVIGVLNVTPDSFSDGGRFETQAAAVDAAIRMAGAGADIVDVGGESTRPGADPVETDEECRRVVPVIEAIRREHPGLRISIDTRKACVARRALDGGADLINDVSGGGDPEMLPLAATTGAPIALMHMRGEPETMQRDTHYDDLVTAIAGFLRDRVETAIAAGVASDKILVDPGIGFGKSAAGNLEILSRLPELQTVGRPILIGASRKSFIGALLELPVDQRLEASLAVAAYAGARGAHLIRAHDVAATRRTVDMIDAIRRSANHTVC